MEKNKIHIYLYNALIVLCLLGGAVYVVSQFMHFGGGEFTDNARVRQNVVPQSSRVQGDRPYPCRTRFAGNGKQHRYHQDKHDRYRSRHRIRTCTDGECHA